MLIICFSQNYASAIAQEASTRQWRANIPSRLGRALFWFGDLGGGLGLGPQNLLVYFIIFHQFPLVSSRILFSGTLAPQKHGDMVALQCQAAACEQLRAEMAAEQAEFEFIHTVNAVRCIYISGSILTIDVSSL